MKVLDLNSSPIKSSDTKIGASQPETRNPKPEIRNPEPETWDLKPATRNNQTLMQDPDLNPQTLTETGPKLKPPTPLSSEYGTHEIVKARYWPWLSGSSP
jgi:hypothetical protein